MYKNMFVLGILINVSLKFHSVSVVCDMLVQVQACCVFCDMFYYDVYRREHPEMFKTMTFLYTRACHIILSCKVFVSCPLLLLVVQ